MWPYLTLSSLFFSSAYMTSLDGNSSEFHILYYSRLLNSDFLLRQYSLSPSLSTPSPPPSPSLSSPSSLSLSLCRSLLWRTSWRVPCLTPFTSSMPSVALPLQPASRACPPPLLWSELHPALSLALQPFTFGAWLRSHTTLNSKMPPPICFSISLSLKPRGESLFHECP